MSGRIFDINLDMGEGYGNWRTCDDAAVMPLISTANIACGYHAGDPSIMRTTIELARQSSVSIGAHPGLPDLLGFGRRVIDVTPNDLYAYIVYQVGALQGFMTAAGLSLTHVKPHGAMFYVLRDPVLADAALDAVAAVAPGTSIYLAGPVGRELFATRAMARGIRICPEAYPDLEYTDDGSVIVQRHKKPVEPDLVYARVKEIITKKTLTTRSGKVLPMDVNNVCLHSDGPNVLEVIDAARRAIADCELTLGSIAQH
ncbi:5-oxoprolinase subunit PxpA [Mesorhizobium amorphae]|uniref:5-oxoprolinase subunit PxpA n=1 Tax=Mesorhizobium amorphae TaxID=71433 RepID=UPI00177D70C0|nr:5-oxoprolinase subunit PxpA [Mesorhizobium amorphae]